MLVHFTRWGTLLGFSLAIGAGMAACGGSKGTTTDGTGAAGGKTTTSTTAGSTTSGMGGMGGSILAGTTGSLGTGGQPMQGFDVEPTPIQTISVPIGQTAPTVTYTATLNGNPATSTGWSLDQGDIGAVAAGPASTTTFTPTGTTGGLVNVLAGLNGMTLKRQVFVQLTGTQNGSSAGNPSEATQIPGSVASLTAGGGVGGVGGEGLGGAVSDMPTLMALGAPSGDGSAQGLAYLYPYDKTVFPRGLLAPLIQWTWSTGDADAIQIALKTASGSFSWTGTFGRPPILAMTGGKFTRMPIPEDVWDMATNTAGGATPSGMPDTLTVSLTVAKGGMAYGPVSETWTIAPARLAGTIYYQSYGTQLAQNLCCNIGNNMSPFGGAVLSIHVGDTSPKIAAGGTSNALAGDTSGCRVCHAVASGGSRLIAVDGDNEGLSTAYTLAPAGTTSMVMGNLAVYPAMYPDGSMALTEQGRLLPLPAGAPPIATMGLTAKYPDLGEPAFSPDGTMIAFNPRSLASKPNQTLYVMAFDKATSTFSGDTLVADDSANPAATQPGWPAFFPDSKSVVYHHQTLQSLEDNLATRAGSHAQIYWTSLNSPSDVTPLDNLNGKGYLPKLPAPSTMTCTADGISVAANPTAPLAPNLDHSDDVDMNYEPTVNPIASGGYAWVVFTSRRMYGSVASIPPYCSDPRGVNLTANANPLATNITPKKLWVAAVNLSQAPGTDSSHPAFYLPAQELLAGNARGFWTLDPCLGDGSTCMTGDQCCNGFCEPGDGGLVCSNTSPNGMCSGLQEKCTTAANCCDPTNVCVNGFCALAGPM